MRRQHRVGVSAVLVLVVALAVLAFTVSPAGAAGNRQIPSGGTTQIVGGALGTDAIQSPEFPKLETEAGTPVVNRPRHGKKIFPKKPLDAPKVGSAGVAGSNPELALGFNGLNFRDQRLANGGNQFSLEPPDQALCVANGKVLESVNTVLRVFDTTGGPLTGVMDHNTFYGYPAQFNRTTLLQGPFITDPVCIYDANIGRFVHVVLTIDVNPVSGNFLGTNHLDVAISDSNDPTGTWTRYSIPVQNDGTGGTVDDGCPTPDPGDLTGDETNPRAEIGDYPHIGADANGIYLTTNGYCFFSSRYNGADIYAIGKAQLSGLTLPASLDVQEIHNAAVEGSPGFTVWPATSLPGQYSTERNGTEYFLSTLAGDGSETGNPTGTAKKIALWALSNTASLNSGSPALTLSSKAIPSEAYVLPPTSDQKPGDFPLGQCINDTSGILGGFDCWELFFLDEPAHDEVISTPDSNDTRMQQVWYTNGQLWGTADTGVDVGGELKAGIAWFMVDPKVDKKGKVNGNVKKQGYLALANNNLTYPALALRPDGVGAMAFTVLGEDYHPSAGYALMDGNAKKVKDVVGPVHVGAAGLGVDDGFTSYKAFVGDPPRTRWGDYGAALVDGNDLWIASEYIAQTCDLNTYLFGGPIGSCGGTRASFGNWATRVSKLTP
jgi:hypothetical protein